MAKLKKLEPKVVVSADNLDEYLGVRKFTYGRAEHANQVFVRCASRCQSPMIARFIEALVLEGLTAHGRGEEKSGYQRCDRLPHVHQGAPASIHSR